MMLYQAWTVIVLLLAILYVKENNAQRANTGEDDLNSWTQWAKCSNQDNCDWKRSRICADADDPYFKCGNAVWEEKYKNCLCKPPGIWYRNSITKCQGNTCSEKLQMETLRCSDEINQANCEKITTKYCDLETTCDGSWGNWVTGECYYPSTLRLQRSFRTCLKNEDFSSNCAGTLPVYVMTKIAPCRLSSPAPSTTKTTATTKTKQVLIPSLKTTTASAISVKDVAKSVRKINGKEDDLTTSSSPINDPQTSEKPGWWTGKTYILVIQSIIILVLVLIILYLLYLKKRKVKTLQPVMIEPSIRSPSLSQNWPQDVPEENQQDRQPPVYSKLLPNHRLSCPDFQRPLPEIPTSFRPPKPPRRNRAATQPQKFYKNSPKPSSFLDVSHIPRVTFSAPTSPACNDSSQDPFLLQSRDDATYLSPIN